MRAIRYRIGATSVRLVFMALVLVAAGCGGTTPKLMIICIGGNDMLRETGAI